MDEVTRLIQQVATHSATLDYHAERMDKHGERIDSVADTTQLLLVGAREYAEQARALTAEIKRSAADIQKLDAEKVSKDRMQWIEWFAFAAAGALIYFAWQKVIGAL